MILTGPYFFLADPSLHQAVVRLVLDAVGDHQFAARLVARVDHLLALGDAVGHGLFAEDVLARLRAAHGVFGVQVPLGRTM